MAQHDYVLDNATGAAFRVDLNAVLQAIITQNSGSSAPTVTKPYMFWASTGDNKLKQRNGADTAWIDICELNAPIAKAGANSDITSLTAAAVTAAVDDKVLIQDTSASDVLKTVTTQSIADLPIVSPSKAIGYGTGAGGEVTQATDKGTGVTLSTPTGKITMNNASLASNATVGFILTNTLITTSDILVLSHSGGAAYNVWSTSNLGSAGIYVRNITGSPLSDAVVINFAIIKGAIA